ncbi:MAG: asparagine synthase-related protein [bacterium]
MPGLYGFYRKKSFTPEKSEELLARMRSHMQRAFSRISDSHSLGRFAAGRLTLGTLDPSPQPVTSPDNRYILFFDGQIYEYHSLVQELKERGYLFTRNSEAELIMNLFLDRGRGFARLLKGVFTVVIYDTINHSLLLANDRYGLLPLYCKDTAEQFTFASELKALVPVMDGARRINQSALCDFYNFQFITEDKTFLSDINLLPYATVMEVSETGCIRERYWNYPYQNQEKDPGLDALIEEGYSLIRKAVENQWKPGFQVGIPLSGGLDSRLLGTISSQNKRRVNFFHAGSNPRYLETQVAQRVCGFLSGEWHFVDLLSQDVTTLIPEVLILNDSHFSCHQSWLLEMAKRAAREGKANILLDGYCFDAQLGSTFSILGPKPPSEERCRLIRTIYSGLQPELARQFFTPEFARSLMQVTDENIRRMSEERGREPVENWLQYFCFVNRARRYTIGNSWVARNYIESAFPYMDYDVFDFCLRLPSRYRYQSHLYRQIFLRYFPSLAKIPWSKTGLPLDRFQSSMSCLRDLVKESGYYLNRLTRGQMEWGNPDINPDRRFRKDPAFRRFFMDILRDSRTMNRGTVSRQGIENLVNCLDSGRNYFHLVEAIVTVEYFFRTFVD